MLGAVCLLGAAPSGAIFLTSLPSGADVWLDGTYVGRSPLVVDALAVGEHHLTLTRSGWTPRDLSVSVAAAQTVASSVVLARDAKAGGAAAGTIAVHAAVPPATVTLDGQPAQLGKDGVIATSAGVHEIAFGEGSSKFVRQVTVYPQTRTEVVLRAEAERRSVVIAPADDYLPSSAYKIDGARLVVHYAGHDVIARLGIKEYSVDRRPAAFDSAPTVIGTRLYLPLELLTMLTANDKH